MRLMVAIPTRDRPVMLARCLASLAACRPLVDVSVEILVIDNASAPDAFARVEALLRDWRGPHPARLAREARTGHPFVRNRALDEARDAGADALFFLDDDQTIAPDGLETALRVMRERDADVVKLEVRWDYEPPGRFREYFDPPPRPDEAGLAVMERRSVGTNGVLIAARLWRGLGLRFDERFPLCGGEDTDFFVRATEAGARAVLTRESHVTELCPAAKQTRGWLLRSAYRVGNAEALLGFKGYSRGKTLRRNAPKAAANLLFALLLLPFGRASFRRLMRAAKACGAVAGALGFPFGAYRRVVGR